MVERTAVFPAGRHSLYAEHRYSAAIRSGDLLFVSGQVGSREDGTPEPDFQQQVRLAFDNLHATLAPCTAWVPAWWASPTAPIHHWVKRAKRWPIPFRLSALTSMR